MRWPKWLQKIKPQKAKKAVNHKALAVLDPTLTPFKGLSSAEKEALANLAEVITLKKGQTLIKKNEIPKGLYLLDNGELEFQDGLQQDEKEILITVYPDKLIGLYALVAKLPNKTSIRAKTDARVYFYPFTKLRSHASLHNHLIQNVANELAKECHINQPEEISIIKAKLNEARAKNILADFTHNMLWLLAIYTLSLSSIIHFKSYLPYPNLIATMLMVIMAGVIIVLMSKTGLPFKYFGFSMCRWLRFSFLGLLYTVPILLLMFIFKWLYFCKPCFVLNPSFFFTSNHHLNWIGFLPQFAACFFFSFTHELLTRSALQSSFYYFLTGSSFKRGISSILLSNLLFTMVHAHVNLSFSFAAFILGLFWGWLYFKQRSFISVLISHFVVCLWALFILGIPLPVFEL